MKDWIQQHLVSAVLIGLAVLAVLQVGVSLAIGTSLQDSVNRILINAVVGGGLLYLVVRHERTQKTALATQGIPAYIPRPGARPGSLDDLWAGGTISCQPGLILFQEAMAGTAVPLGKPKKFDVVSVTHDPRHASGSEAKQLPPKLSMQTFALVKGTLEIAAEAAALADITGTCLGGSVETPRP